MKVRENLRAGVSLKRVKGHHGNGFVEGALDAFCGL